MKLSCDSCNAKYSIADERVAGKLFKIRCKKCSHVILVRGVEVVPAIAPPIGEWHAVVDGQQLGPFDRDEVLRQREAGTLDDDTFVWREGMTDWAALGTLEELRAQPTAPPSVEVSDMTRLRNERNETSVLFTLGNLAQLASKPQPKPAAAIASATGEEGSGLIDIRALASTWAQPAANAKPATPVDDPLSVYTPIGLADPIVLVPTTSHGTDRRLLVALVAMLAMIAGLATVLVVVVTRDGGSAQAAPTPVVMPVPVNVEAPPPPPPIETPPPPKAEVAAPIAATTPPPKRTRTTPRTPAPKLREPVVATKEECTEVSCAYSNYAEECCDPFRPRGEPKRTTTTTSTNELPENLDRAALARGIATIKAQSCGASSSAKGDVNVSVKVTAGGAVSSVTVKSSPDASLSACVVRAAKQGTFAKTKRGGSFSYFWRF